MNLNAKIAALVILVVCVLAFPVHAEALEKGWTMPGYDLARTNFYPFPAKVHLTDPPEEIWNHSFSGRISSILTGDVAGDENLEIVVLELTTNGYGALHVLDCNGHELWKKEIYGHTWWWSSYPDVNLRLLADVDNDGKQEIFIGRVPSDGTGEILVYDGNGDLLKKFTKTGLGDGGIYAYAVFERNGKKELWAGITANYRGNPRGTVVFDWDTGNVIWFYRAGSYAGAPSAAMDVNGDGLLEFALGGASTHNGGWGRGRTDLNDAPLMTDSNAWVAVFNFSGHTILAKNFGEGAAIPRFADLNKDGKVHLYVERHHEPAYPGYSGIYKLDPLTGRAIGYWKGFYNHRTVIFSIADVNGDGRDELVAIDGAWIRYVVKGSLYIFDGNLTLLAKREGEFAGAVTNDVNGDGKVEIIVYDFETGKHRVLRGDLTDLWDVGGLPCDLNNDGINELIERNASKVIVYGWKKPDLRIFGIEPVQVVFWPDINGDGKTDLVQEKATAVIVYVVGFEGLSNDTVIDVNLSFEGKNITKSKTVGELKQDNKIVFHVTPENLGDEKITVEVDPFNRIDESNENNNFMSKVVTVKDTRGLHIVYFRVNDLLCGAPDFQEFRDTAEHSGVFVKATYPVAGSEFTNEIRSEEYFGTPFGTPVIVDLIGLTIWKWLLGAGDRAVGIVSDLYFPCHLLGENVTGIANPIITKDAVLVRNGYWTATAHEIGHTYGLPLTGKEEYNETYDGNSASGYWVEKDIEITNGVCFMGKAPEDKHTYQYLDRRYVWVDDEDYSYLFKQFRVNQSDPANVLLIGGLIYKNGTIELTKFYYLENRTIEPPIPGNWSVVLVDWDGKEVERVNFSVTFYLLADPYGVIETNVSGFVFPVPFPENTSKFIIQRDNVTVLELNPNTKLLHDAIDSIPDYGFINNPDQRRNALHHKIDAVEKMLEKGKIKPAVEKLKHDIRDKLVKWLVDYEVENPLQLTKSQVISLVDEIIERLSLQIQPQSQQNC